MELREAKLSDAELYFFWVNDAEVRESALNKELVQWDSHLEWFENKLHSNSTMLIMLKDNEAVGQIRFDLDKENIYYLDYSIDLENRGKGLGQMIVEMGIIYLRNKNNHGKLIAKVKKDNFASNKVFHKLLFDFIDEVMLNTEIVNIYELIL